jgi:GNAT superfamily N-acetyltransferase
MSLAFAISDLRLRPEFFDSVADRIWQEWWKPNGYPRDYIAERLTQNMKDTPIPLALVAHDASGADLTFATTPTAHSQANVKSKAPLESIFSSGPLIPTFASVPATTGCECWNRTTSAFLGTASVIASDLDERPELTPWVAAVWVEETARGHGVGAALVEQATQASFALGFARTYLCARAPMTPFYEGLGWTLIERGVGPHQLGVFIREAGASARPVD